MKRRMLPMMSSGGAAVWTPLNLPNLYAWYDFSDISTLFQDAGRTTPVTTDGNPIGGVADKSGNGRHVSQATTSAMPTYKTNIYNGKSIGRGDGGDRLNATLTAQSSWTIYAVAKRLSLSPSAVARVWNIGTNAKLNLFDYSGMGDWGFYNNLTQIGGDPSTLTIITVQVQSGSGAGYINNGSSVALSPVTFNAETALYLFGSSEAATERLNGDIGEIVICNGYGDASDRSSVLAYMNPKWAVYA